MTVDASGFREVAARYHAAIARICRHYEVSAESRRDLEQEILVGLWRALGTFRGESSEKTFVLRVAHNMAVSHVTRSARARRLEVAATPDATSGTAPDVHADARATLARLDRRLRAMDLVSRQLVLLALEGCTTAELSEITGLTPTNVTTRLSRLRRALTKEEESP